LIGAILEEEKKSGPTFLKIPDLNEVLVGELAERGDWVVGEVQTTGSWPVVAQKVSYRGEIVWILPVVRNHFPAVAMKVRDGLDRDGCARLLMRFLSTLSWVEGEGYLVDGFGGGSRPIPMGREKTVGLIIRDEFDLSYFPEPTDEKALLALALMREGRGLNHPGYAFLSFYRVLEIAFPDGQNRGRWMRDRVDTITDHRAREVVAALRASGISDVGVHLRDSGRRAMAHAREEPIIDPDDPSDARRLWSELPLMLALARTAIEEVLGIETSHTVWKNHLHELAGFKQTFGPDIVEHLVRGDQITDGRPVSIPNIKVQLRGRQPYPPLSNLIPIEIGQNGTALFVHFGSEDQSVEIRFRLDFVKERLEFDMFNDVAVSDVGTPEAAETVAEVKRFLNEYFSNGQLHIYDAETGALISRKDAFLPVNMFSDRKAADAEIALWKREAARRREKCETT
jgi:hypothetical protein